MAADTRGFTLIEVLVSMVLVSMVTLIITMALRISLNAWERGQGEGENSQVAVALPSLMEKQLMAVTNPSSLINGLDLSGTGFLKQDNRLAFFTRYSPEGSPWQGVMHITYVYDDISEKLEIFEKRITQPDDMTDSEESETPASIIRGIKTFNVGILSDTKKHPTLDEDGFYLSSSLFQESWDERSKKLPGGVRLEFAFSDGSPRQKQVWFFKAGGAI